MQVYVEIEIAAPIEDVWRLSQTPDLHERWDLRFTEIQYLPRADDEPQRFLYATRIGFGLRIEGRGESVAAREGEAYGISSLKFWSDDPKSLIREGSGYWKYIKSEDATTFLTGYDYQVRFGRVGTLFDRLVFRSLIGWATAWSFDSMRLWIEKGIPPESQRRAALCHLCARVALAIVWMYMGLVPKLLYSVTGEQAIFERAALPLLSPEQWRMAVGVGEIAFGFLLLFLWRARWPFILQIIGLFILSVAAAFSAPEQFTSPFNLVSLNVSLIALSLIALLTMRDLPTASHCLRKPRKKQS